MRFRRPDNPEPGINRRAFGLLFRTCATLRVAAIYKCRPAVRRSGSGGLSQCLHRVAPLTVSPQCSQKLRRPMPSGPHVTSGVEQYFSSPTTVSRAPQARQCSAANGNGPPAIYTSENEVRNATRIDHSTTTFSPSRRPFSGFFRPLAS